MNNDKIRPLTRYRIALWVCVGIVSVFLICIIVAVHVPSIFGDKFAVLVTLFAILMVVFSIGVTLSAYAIREEKRFIKQLEIENSYTLGEANQFYNLDAFKIRFDNYSHRRQYRYRKKYILAFTPTALNISSNRGREKLLTSLNLRLAHFLEGSFNKNTDPAFDPRYIVYAFSRGVFFIAVFTNDETLLNKIMNHISNECFRMVNEDKIKIWVQPFFGIKTVANDESIVSAIEDALIARDNSEKNYESYTFFKESFRNVNTGASNEIYKALENDEFIPYYQPKYSLKEKRFVSAEALARWNSPTHGLVGPAKFIDEAEKAGLLNAIDIRIFERTIQDISENLKRGRPVLPVSVNFSLYEFFSRKFIDTIMDTLKKFDVPAKYLEIEITETTSQVNKFLSLSVIKKLKSFGIRVLMDDFGVGYSQIENLRQVPFDAIKIDKSFTDRIVSDLKTFSIVKYLVELAHVNNIEAIVEGVETKEQLDVLRKIKADTIQGFYFSKPLSLKDYNELLKNNEAKKGTNK